MKVLLSTGEVLYAIGSYTECGENRVRIEDSNGYPLHVAQESMSTERIVSDWLTNMGCHYDEDRGIWIVESDSCRPAFHTSGNKSARPKVRAMSENPISNERVIRIESQLLLWIAGRSLHNGQHRRHGECVPDFSCCQPLLMSSPEERIKIGARGLKDALIAEMRSFEPLEGEEVDLEQQEWFVRVVDRWFEDLLFDTLPAESDHP